MHLPLTKENRNITIQKVKIIIYHICVSQDETIQLMQKSKWHKFVYKFGENEKNYRKCSTQSIKMTDND